MIKGEITVRGLLRAINTIQTVGERANDVRPIKEQVRAIVLRSNERQWAAAPWAPLSDATVERKARELLDSRPERATGALYRSLTANRSKGQVNRAKRDQLRFGSRLFYAAWQQGTLFQPKRDLISLTPIDREEIDRLLTRYIAKGHGGVL